MASIAAVTGSRRAFDPCSASTCRSQSTSWPSRSRPGSREWWIALRLRSQPHERPRGSTRYCFGRSRPRRPRTTGPELHAWDTFHSRSRRERRTGVDTTNTCRYGEIAARESSRVAAKAPGGKALARSGVFASGSVAVCAAHHSVFSDRASARTRHEVRCNRVGGNGARGVLRPGHRPGDSYGRALYAVAVDMPDASSYSASLARPQWTTVRTSPRGPADNGLQLDGSRMGLDGLGMCNRRGRVCGIQGSWYVRVAGTRSTREILMRPELREARPMIEGDLVAAASTATSQRLARRLA